jgi:2-phospho-L-lactate transferase/gluconeogenesis factor (CofD/UPF0052 family)
MAPVHSGTLLPGSNPLKAQLNSGKGVNQVNEQDIEVTPIKISDHVIIVNETYEERHALVTAVHGDNWSMHTPSINVVYVSSDPAKHDPYGQQLERLSSLSHYNNTHGMPKRGRYWKNA